MKKIIPCLLGVLITAMVGCQSTDDKSSNVSDIKDIKFTLPAQIQWNAMKSKDGVATIYLPKMPNVDFNNTPVKVVYQKQLGDKALAKSPKAIADEILSPMKKHCKQVGVGKLKPVSTYANQQNYQVLCNQIKGKKFGVIAYLSIYSDKNGRYVLSSDVKTPVMTKPGEFAKPKGKKQEQALGQALGLNKLIQNMMTTAKVCDTKEQCQ